MLVHGASLFAWNDNGNFSRTVIHAGNRINDIDMCGKDLCLFGRFDAFIVLRNDAEIELGTGFFAARRSNREIAVTVEIIGIELGRHGNGITGSFGFLWRCHITTQLIISLESLDAFDET